MVLIYISKTLIELLIAFLDIHTDNKVFKFPLVVRIILVSTVPSQKSTASDQVSLFTNSSVAYVIIYERGGYLYFTMSFMKNMSII
jgi:hypothetical protein